MKLKDKVAIVTGAGSGIGAGISEVFANNGARVVVVDRLLDDAESVAASIRKSGGGDARAMMCDVSDESQVSRTVSNIITQYGRVDALVNNAGVFFGKAFEQSTVADWHRVLAVDLTGTF